MPGMEGPAAIRICKDRYFRGLPHENMRQAPFFTGAHAGVLFETFSRETV